MNLSFFKDRAFLHEVFVIALPISLQQFVNAAMNMIDVVMVGQLGEASIAALGLSNQVFFVFVLMLFGTTSGMAIFTAQYWGKKEIDPIRQVTGMSMITTSIIALAFTLAAVLIPRSVLGFYTNDPEVIEIGAGYLRIVGFSYILVAIATSYIATLRSVQFVNITVVATVIALAFKTILGYMLIFGIGRFPELGVRGAAIATALGWTLELILLIILVYTQKTPLAANPFTFFRFDIPFFSRVLRTTLPALANEFFWSVGITTYNAIYAHISTDAIAAVNVNATIEELAFVFFMGLGNAGAVLVGNRIGAGDKESAYETVRRTAIMAVMLSWVVGVVIFILRDAIVGLYDLSGTSQEYVRMLLLVLSVSLWIRMFNFSTFISALRAGGDTRFALIMEICSIWLIGVPAAYTGAFILHLPVYLVYLMVILEEIAKAFVSGWRVWSRRWIHDLVNAQ